MARDLRLFYLFRLLSTSYLYVPVLVAFALSRGLSLVEVGWLGSIYSAVVIATEVPTGALADRFGRRPAMMVGALAMMAACLVSYGAHSFAMFAAGTALSALSMTLCSGADSAYLFDLLHDHGRGEEYPRNESMASTWHQVGQTLAFAAGGLLGALDLALPYLATAGVSLLAFVVALSMRKDPAPAVTTIAPREYVDHVRASFRIVIGRRRLMWVIGYSAVVFVLLRSTEYVYQPYLAASGFGVAETGLIFAAVYLVAAAVAHHSDGLRRRFSEPLLLTGLLVTLVVTFLVLGQIAGPLALAVLGVQAAANGLYSPLVKPMLNRDIHDSKRRATVLSVESMVRRAAFGLFTPLMGWLMYRYSPGAALTVCGLFGVLGFALLAAGLRTPSAPAASSEIAPGGAAIKAPREPG